MKNMVNRRLTTAATLILLFSGVLTGATAERKDSDLSGWIEPQITARPWSYWWWMGSAVDETNIIRELTTLKKAGWGGVHIIPIYGAKGWEDKYIEYLSPRWLHMLDFTVRKARELGMDVDMTLGTGWCFGGPTVSDDDANARLMVRTNVVKAGEKYSYNFQKQKIQRLMGFEKDGEVRDLTSLIKPNGSVEWIPDKSEWIVYAIWQQPSGQKVKRAAPGGEGHMLNLIYPDAMQRYLNWFDTAFANYKGAYPRAIYHDSYEYRSEWSPDLLSNFYTLRGYKLEEYLPYLFRHRNDETARRIICDYRETVSDVMIEHTMKIWSEWAKKRGFITRNEAHGSPANLLDLYAIADIPETEMFSKDRNTLISKFASSAAHVSGKRLTSAETGTWLKEHFHSTLMDIKVLVDQLFVSGVNHVIFHGTCYSPAEAPWPGWLFYASIQMNPRNSIWRDVPALAAYITRVQAIMQHGEPYNDILVYYPMYDVWQKLDGLLPHFTIHGLNWFEGLPVSQVSSQLWAKGYSFDFVSDRQIAGAKVVSGSVVTEGGTKYKCVVIPECSYMPEKTLVALLNLARDGGKIIFAKALPADVPGFANLENRREKFNALKNQIRASVVNERLNRATGNNGLVFVGDVFDALGQIRVAPHMVSETGNLEYVVRRTGTDYYIFAVNRGESKKAAWFDTGLQSDGVILMNAITGESGLAKTKKSENSTLVYLELEPYESIILHLFNGGNPAIPEYKFCRQGDKIVAVKGAWNIEFIEGGPTLPKPRQINNPIPWTDFGDEECTRFAGTARYSVKFDLPERTTKAWYLDLGEVHQSARVYLNGKYLGTLFTTPFVVRCENLKEKDNLLEIEVTSLAANRIRDLDRRKVQWKIFRDINIVNINYKPFDASDWEIVKCGLSGPVRLIEEK
jgi:hypothetical protein